MTIVCVSLFRVHCESLICSYVNTVSFKTDFNPCFGFRHLPLLSQSDQVKYGLAMSAHCLQTPEGVLRLLSATVFPKLLVCYETTQLMLPVSV